MAFNPLTEAECGQKNPLGRLASHITHDHAFGEVHGHLFPSSSDQLVEQFLQETKTLPQSFRMDDLMREMHEIESQRLVVPPVPASAIKDQINDNAWAQQYIEDGKMFHDNMNNEAIWAEISTQEQHNSHLEDWRGEFFQDVQPGPSNVNASQLSAQELVQSAEDPKFAYSKFMRFMSQVGDGEINLEEGRVADEKAQSWSEEFLQNNADTNVDEAAKKWQKNYEEDFNSRFWDNLQEELKQVDGMETNENSWLNEFDSYYSGPYQEYTFSEENPMFDVNDPLERGKKLLEEGDLPSAVLCFEAAVNKEPENSEAWFLLGKSQAENEQDNNAIPALNKCLQIDPSNLAALMALAVSYTNESYYTKAGQTLLKWLANNPKYKDLVPVDFKLNSIGQVTSFLQPDQHKLIQDLFIKAALRQPEDIDYEVQCGLGVLFNLSGEYEKAADCFRAALSVKPEDAKLWNRLGATLANGSKSEEAVDAYHQALNLEPGFIRARYNVGIICINLQAYRQAAEHFLTALNQQARGRDIKSSTPTMSQMSDTIWSTLRMVISLLNKPELRPAVDERNLEILNKEFIV